MAVSVRRCRALRADARRLGQIYLRGRHNDGNCTRPTVGEDGFLPTRVIGDSTANCTDETEWSQFSSSDEVGQTNSLEIKTGFKYTSDFWLGKAEASLEIDYGHTWENKHTFTQAFNLPVKPKYIIWVTDEVPVITYTGDYTLKVNDATLEIPDVAFHTPSTTKDAIWASHEAALTPAQATQMCSGTSGGPFR
jgi:hypothetical protein